jgi:hypothetical protein
MKRKKTGICPAFFEIIYFDIKNLQFDEIAATPQRASQRLHKPDIERTCLTTHR